MASPSLVGQTLGRGRYALRERLGEGGWGVVYAATQLDLGRQVAIKVLHLNVALTAEGLGRFEREAKAAAALGHPNIAQVTDFQANEGEPPFFVMEMLTGDTLGMLLTKHGPMPSARVAWIAHQMLAALDVAHGAGMIHRDVKPDNVFLVQMTGVADFVKLLDFGIAKLSGSTSQGAPLTQDGSMLGTPAFMAPEHIRGQPIDHRVDLYAVGATMYCALAGKMPFDVSQIHQLLYAITELPPQPLQEIVPSVDPALAAIVAKAMAKDPNARFGSAAEMRDALSPWLGSHPRPPSGNVGPATYPSGPNAPPALSAVSPLSMTAEPGTPNGTAAMPMVSPMPRLAPPPPFASGPMTSQAAPYPMMMPHGPPAHAMPAPPARSNGAIIGLLVVIGLLLFVIGGGAVAFLLLRSSPTASTPVVATATPTAAPTPSVIALTTATATATAGGAPATVPTPTGAPPKGKVTPGPSGAPVVVVVDAGGISPAPAGRKEYGGASPRCCSGTFGKYDIEQTKAAFNRAMGGITACYAASQYDPPDHQFQYYTFAVDSGGSITSVAPVTEASNHPKLNACLFPIFRGIKVQAIPGGGQMQLSFTARTKDNP